MAISSKCHNKKVCLAKMLTKKVTTISTWCVLHKHKLILSVSWLRFALDPGNYASDCVLIEFWRFFWIIFIEVRCWIIFFHLNSNIWWVFQKCFPSAEPGHASLCLFKSIWSCSGEIYAQCLTEIVYAYFYLFFHLFHHLIVASFQAWNESC